MGIGKLGIGEPAADLEQTEDFASPITQLLTLGRRFPNHIDHSTFAGPFVPKVYGEEIC